MQNYDVAVRATNTSINSQGSALQENARYLESANAKVNKLKVAWEELALSAGNTVFIDMITTITNDLRYLVNAINALITLDPSKGSLATGFTMLAGLTGGFTTLMNGSVRNAVFEGRVGDGIKEKLEGVSVAYREATEKVNANRLAVERANALGGQTVTVGNQTITMMDKLKGSAIATGGGFKVAGAAVAGFAKTVGVAIATSLGIGVAIAGVTMAVGYLFTKFNEYRAKAAEEQQRQKEELKLYTDNAVAVDELAERYETLKNKTNRSVEETQLMYDTAKQLGSYLPNLVSHVDELGRTHLVNAVTTKEYVETLKEAAQVKAYEEYEKTTKSLKENEEAIQKNIEKNEKLIKKKKELEEIGKKEKPVDNGFGYGEASYDAVALGTAYVPGSEFDSEEQKKARNNKLTAEQIKLERESNANMLERNLLLRDTATYYGQLSDEYVAMSAKEQDMFNATLEQSVSGLIKQINEEAKKSGEAVNTEKAQEEVEKLTDKLLELFGVVTELPSFDKTLFEGMAGDKQGSAYRDTIDQYIAAVEEFEKRKNELLTQNNVQTADGLVGQALTEYKALVSYGSQVSSVGKEIVDSAINQGVALNQATKEIFNQNISLDENRKKAVDAVISMSDLEEVNSDVAGAVSEATSAIDELGSALGYADGELRRTMSTVDAYNDILAKNADGYTYTVDEMVGLIDKNPELIKAFNVQNGAVSLNTAVVEELREVQRIQFLEKIKQTQESMVQEALTAQLFAEYSGDKVKSIKTVAEAEKELVRVKQQAAIEIAKIEGAMASIDKNDPNYGRQMYAGDLAARMSAQLDADTRKIQEGLDNIEALGKNAEKIGAAIVTPTKDLYNANKAAAESNKKVSETEKNKQDSISRSTYLTNKYTEAIDKATAAVQKQAAFKNKYSQGSKAYIRALETEIKAMDKQKKSVSDYIKALQTANKQKKVIASTGVHTSTQEVMTDAKGNIVARGGTTKGYDVLHGSSSASSSSGGFKKTGTRALSGWSGAKVSSNYNTMRTINGMTWRHEGTDIVNKRGTPLESNVNGTVVWAGKANSSLGIPSQYGNNVVIQDTSGIFHIYAHLDRIDTKKGAKIGAGQRIGTIGNTGNSTGAHLHYEQRSAMGKWNKNVLNPTVSARQAIAGKRNTYSFSNSGSSTVSKASASSMTKASSSSSVVKGSGLGALKGKEDVFNRLGAKYGVDPALAFAIAMWETGNGTSKGVKSYNNPGGMMSPSSNWTKQTVFKTLDQGIEAMISNLSRNYIQKGLTSIETIQKKYAPDKAGNDPNGLNAYWTNGVNSMYKKVTNGKSPSSAASGSSSFAPTTQVDKEKKIADKSKADAERAQSLAQQKEEENKQIEELNKIEQATQDLILQLLNLRADYFKSMYERYNKDADAINGALEAVVGATRQSLALYENLESNAKLQKRSVALEIKQMEKDRKSSEYKRLDWNRKAEFDNRLADLKRLLKQEVIEERRAALEVARERAEIRGKLIDNQMRGLRKNSDFIGRQLAIMDGESNKEVVKKYALTVEQEKAERKLWDIKKRQLDTEKKILSGIQKKFGTSSKEYEQQLEFVKRYSEELLALEDSINGLNSAQKDMAQGFANDIIETIKDAIEKQREAEIKSIDKIQKDREKAIMRERNVRKNAHEATMKELEEERKKMNDFFDERLKQLDQQDDERSHQKQMSEFSKRENEIRSALNRISMDDSFEAKAKRKDLMKELQGLQEEREEYLYRRDFDKLKEAINNERDLYEKGMDEKTKKEEDAYEKFEKDLDRREEAERALFDKMLEDLNQYYDDILNDERKWNKIREQAMKGNFDAVKKMANEMLVDTSLGFRKMYEDIGKTYDGVLKDLSYLFDDTEYETMNLADSITDALSKIVHTSSNSFDSLGKVLQTNYIDKLKEALDLMARLTGKDFDMVYKNPSKNDDMSQDSSASGLSMFAKQTASAKAVIVRDSASGTAKAIGSLVDGKGYQVLEQGASYSRVSLGNGKSGWVSNAELSASKANTSWGVAGSNTMASQLNKLVDPISKLLSDFSTSNTAHQGRLDKIGYDSGKRVYDDMVSGSTSRIRTKYQEALNAYYLAYEKSTSNADRTKATEGYIKSLENMQNEIDRARREIDALFESLQSSTTINKNTRMESNGALYKDPYASSAGIIGSIPKGAVITVLKDRGLMYEVKYGDKTGFVNKPNVGSFASGGWYTGDFNGGMPAMLHKKELVLNQEQTKNMLKTVEFTDRMVSPLRALIGKMQSVKGGNASPAIHIENINNDFSNNEIKDGRSASEEFMKQTMNLINNKFGKR